MKNKFGFLREALLALSILGVYPLHANDRFVTETGPLNYKTTEQFFRDWNTSCAPLPGLEGRWAVINVGGKIENILSSGLSRRSELPLRHVIYNAGTKEGKVLFDVSGGGKEKAFCAYADFLFADAPTRPQECVNIALAAVSADGRNSYSAALYANGGKKSFEENYFRIDDINFNAGKKNPGVKTFLWKKTGIRLDPKKWYRLEFTMTRQSNAEDAPVILNFSLYALRNGEFGGERSDFLAGGETKMLSSLGRQVQFGMTESSTGGYKVFLANFGARSGRGTAGPQEQQQSVKKNSEPLTQSSRQALGKWRNFFLNRKNEYRKLPGSVSIARNGRPQMTVVVPPDAPFPVRYAASELKSALDTMTGGDFKIAEKMPETGGAIILGDCDAVRQKGIDVSKIARDGYCISASDNTIYIAGRDDAGSKSKVLLEFMTPEYSKRKGNNAKWGNPTWDFERGTLYGTYRFLEELGVRWFLPGDKGTIIPQTKDVTIPAFFALEEPTFALNEASPRIWTWPRLKKSPLADSEYQKVYSSLDWSTAKDMQWKLRMRCSTSYFPMNHHPPQMQFEERFGKTHPEYFALFGGKRSLSSEMGGGRTGALCYSNPEVRNVILQDMDAFFRGEHASVRGLRFTDTDSYGMSSNNGWPYGTNYGNAVSLLPHDLYHPCGCGQCSKLLSDRYGGQMSDLVWKFIKEIAEKNQKVHPDKLIFCLAYSSYSLRPFLIDRLPDNVVVGILPSFERLNQPYALCNPDLEKKYFDFTRGWSKMNQMPLAFWSHWLFRTFNPVAHCGVPMSLPHLLGRYAAQMSQYGRIHYMEMDSDNYMFEHLNRYFFYKMFSNPQQDVDRMLADYADKFYGPAGKLMLAVIIDIEKRSTAVAAKDAQPVEIWTSPDMFNAAVMKKYREDVNLALKMTENTPFHERTKLFSDFFLGFMEKGYAFFESTRFCEQERMKKLRAFNLNEKFVVTEKPLSFEFIPCFGYQDFQRSEAAVCLHDDCLQFILFARESKLNKLRSLCTQNTSAVWSDDCFEIMLVPPDSSSCYQIIVNSRGANFIKGVNTSLTPLAPPPEQLHVLVNASMALEEDTWKVELKIPLRQFPRQMLQGIWKFNVFRNRRIDKENAYQASGIYLKEYNFQKLSEYPMFVIRRKQE